MRATILLTVLLAAGVVRAQDGADDAPDAVDAVDAPGDASAPSSATEVAERHLEVGRELYLQLDFPGTIDAMNRALAVSGASPAQRLEAFEYIGASAVVMDRPDAAREAFRAMLGIDPYHALREPSGSPKIRNFVEELRRAQVPDAALDPELELVAELPEAARAAATVSVAVRARGEGGPAVVTVRVRHRSDEEREWSATELEPSAEGEFEGEVPTPRTTGRMLLYAEARDGAGRLVGRAAEPHWPLRVDVRDELPRPLIRQWWFWTAVGVAAVGLAVGLGVGLAGGEGAPDGSLPPGTVELP